MNNTVAYKDLCAGSTIHKPVTDGFDVPPRVIVVATSYARNTRLLGEFIVVEESLTLTVRDKKGVTSQHHVSPDMKVALTAPLFVPEHMSNEWEDEPSGG